VPKKQLPPEEFYREEDSRKRFIAALRGAREAGHKPMEDLTEVKKKRKPKKKS
jgi:hypothetical protein